MSKYKPVDSPGYIYIIRCEQYHKIGIAKDPRQRAKGIQTDNPFKIHLVKSRYIVSCRMNERYIHDLLFDKNVRGEWFLLNDGEVKILESMIDSIEEPEPIKNATKKLSSPKYRTLLTKKLIVN